MTENSRRSFFAMLAGLCAVSLPAQNSTVKKWYITGGRTEAGIRNDCDVPPIVSYGKDAIDALANSGITVWPEEKWKEIESRFKKSCQNEKPRP